MSLGTWVIDIAQSQRSSRKILTYVYHQPRRSTIKINSHSYKGDVQLLMHNRKGYDTACWKMDRNMGGIDDFSAVHSYKLTI